MIRRHSPAASAAGHGKGQAPFTIKTNGLAIIQDENDTFLADFEGKKVASLGDVIITDKVGKTTKVLLKFTSKKFL